MKKNSKCQPLTTVLFVGPVHAVPVPVADVEGGDAPVVRTLELLGVARGRQVCQHKQRSEANLVHYNIS
jgi:hypothetical protein